MCAFVCVCVEKTVEWINCDQSNELIRVRRGEIANWTVANDANRKRLRSVKGGRLAFGNIAVFPFRVRVCVCVCAFPVNCFLRLVSTHTHSTPPPPTPQENGLSIRTPSYCIPRDTNNAHNTERFVTARGGWNVCNSQLYVVPPFKAAGGWSTR